ETCAPRRPEAYLASETLTQFHEVFEPLDDEAQMQERFAMACACAPVYRSMRMIISFAMTLAAAP
ncbi:MAG: hypothetical protein AAGK60_09170, partial [Pseudomonadota bacterium]